MDKIEINQPGYTSTSIMKNERRWFVSQPEDEIEKIVFERLVSIVYLSPDRSEWKFKDKQTEYWADVTDINFITRMKDKRIDELSGHHFVATVEKTTTKEANTKRVKIERQIFGFKEPLQQSNLPL